MTTIEHLEYMREMADKLEKLAQAKGIESLAYIFAMAKVEAGKLATDGVGEAQDSRSNAPGEGSNLIPFDRKRVN